MQAFWRQGYAATSLDDLSAATGMMRPSLYNAFGDKRKLYLSLLDHYIEESEKLIAKELAPGRPLRQSLQGLFRRILSMYEISKGQPYGCFLLGTAVTEAAADKAVRSKVASFFADCKRTLKKRLSQALAEGEIAPDADAAALADVAAALLHSLGVRARAGESQASLNATIDSVVRLICKSASIPGVGRRKPSA